MAQVKRTITVMDMREVNTAPANAFKIVKMQNECNYKIGEYLSIFVVDSLIQSGYTVNVVEFKR